MQSFITGVNYWPRQTAMRMWQDFDPAQIDRDFNSIRNNLHMQLVRIFLTPDFVPNPNVVSASCVAKLVTVVKLAAQHGLTLDITTGFCLHMSGPNFVAPFTLMLKREQGQQRQQAVEQKAAEDYDPTEGSNPYSLQVVVPSVLWNDDEDEGLKQFLQEPHLVKRTEKYLVFNPRTVSYRNPFHCTSTLRAQVALLTSVATALLAAFSSGDGDDDDDANNSPSTKRLPGVVFNLCNEIDQLAVPRTPQEGLAWARTLSNAIRAVAGDRILITAGLHTDSIRFPSNHLPVAGIFNALSPTAWHPVMHAYPQYQNPQICPDKLDTDFVPFSCVMTSLLIARHKVALTFHQHQKRDDFDVAVARTASGVLMEEFGGCTSHPGAPSMTCTWTTKALGGQLTERKQFLASEEDLSQFLKTVLQKLHRVGALGAVLWCFGDYVPTIWTEPPCDESYHERFFGVLRSDGTPKKHAAVIAEFGAANPTVRCAREVEPLLLQLSKFMSAMDRDDELRSDRVNQKEEEEEEEQGKTAGGGDSLDGTVDWIRRHADSELNSEAALAKVFKRFKELMADASLF